MFTCNMHPVIVARCQLAVWILLLLAVPGGCYIENLYCGMDNCYELLAVSRDATKGDITKAYRKLARKWHPDMHKTKKDKEKAAEVFQQIANAYEILRDEEQRADYDYMLDNPDEYYRHYFYYYRRRVAPKVDVRVVIAVTITVISLVQYLSGLQNYKNAIAYLVTVPKYRLQATDIAKQQGLLDSKRKKDRSKTKEEIREEEENILKKVIEDKMDIRGGYRKPSVLDILWLQLLLSPYYLAKYLWWLAHWTWSFTLLRREYGPQEKEYLVRRNMRLSQGQWDSIEDPEKEKFMSRQLWIKANYKAWKAQQEEEMKAKLAENSRYKAYRRYMKKGGPGQMAFGPE